MLQTIENVINTIKSKSIYDIVFVCLTISHLIRLSAERNEHRRGEGRLTMHVWKALAASRSRRQVFSAQIEVRFQESAMRGTTS